MKSAANEINPVYDEQSGYDTSDSRYPPDWTPRAKAIRKRDEYICQDCGFQSGPYAAEGKGATLDVHHITFLTDGGSNRPANLTTLCVECHNNRHEHDITDGRDYTPKPTPGIGGRLRQLVRSLLGGAVVLPIHGAALYVLLTQAVGSPLWLAGGGYLVVLAVALLVRPKQIAALYGIAGGVGVAITELLAVTLGGESARTLLLSAWVPALLALAWWWHQR